jgi:hypothetical protein
MAIWTVLRRRAIRAWQHPKWTSVYRALLVGILPSSVFAYVAYRGAPSDADVMRTIFRPAIAGAMTLAIVVPGFGLVPFAWRFVRGTAPKESRRTLKHIDVSEVEALLRSEGPPSKAHYTSVYFSNESEEEEDFAEDIQFLLERSGWPASEPCRGGFVGTKRPKDITIYLPDRATSEALLQLHDLLIRHGYKSVLTEGSGIGFATIVVGAPTH